MTSANVSKVTAGMTVPTSASKKSGKDEQEAVDFMSMLGNFAVNNSQQNNPVTFQVSDSASNKTVEYEKLSTKDDRIPKVTGKTDDADMQKVDQAVEEFAKEVQQEVKELLGVECTARSSNERVRTDLSGFNGPCKLSKSCDESDRRGRPVRTFDECGFSGTDAECGSFK